MPISYRPAIADDLVSADELVVGSINHLTERHGFGKIASPRPPPFQLFSMKDDPDGLWVAEDAGQMVGFAWSWACGELWFLAQLFVSPDQQGAGIGNELIKRTWEPAQGKGAANKALITHLQHSIARTLSSARNVSALSDLFFQWREWALGRAFQGRALPICPT